METDKILLGDAYELIKSIPDKSVDLIVTDPPYEIVDGGSAGCFGAEKRSYHKEYSDLGCFEHASERVTKNRAGSKEHNCVGFDYSLLDELDRTMKRINIYIWCSKRQILPLLQHYESKGCNTDLLTWHKTNTIPTLNDNYYSDTEYLVFAREPGVHLFGTAATKHKFYVTTTNKADKSSFGHPTIKPLEIIKNLIINSSERGGLVLDPFCGSGTTCVAAKELGRHFIGFEINPKYHKLAIDRLDGVTVKQAEAGYKQESLF